MTVGRKKIESLKLAQKLFSAPTLVLSPPPSTQACFLLPRLRSYAV